MILLPALPILVPLAGAILCMLFRRNLALQKTVAVVFSLLMLAESLPIPPVPLARIPSQAYGTLPYRASYKIQGSRIKL